MGFYSLYKWFNSWSKRDYPDMIYWYKEYVLKTPEQRKQDRLKKEKEVNTILAQVGWANLMCDCLSSMSKYL